MTVNPSLAEWLDRQQFRGNGRRALVVGCGLGDDAEKLAEIGFQVTAFDIAPTAIEWCRKRWSSSKVDYAVANVLEPPPAWESRFDFILESYTLQSLPANLREQAARGIVACMASGATLLVICRACDDGQQVSGPPGRWTVPPSASLVGSDSARRASTTTSKRRILRSDASGRRILCDPGDPQPGLHVWAIVATVKRRAHVRLRAWYSANEHRSGRHEALWQELHRAGDGREDGLRFPRCGSDDRGDARV